MLTISNFRRRATSVRLDQLLSEESDLIHVTTVAHLRRGSLLVADVMMQAADVLRLAQAADDLAKRESNRQRT